MNSAGVTMRGWPFVVCLILTSISSSLEPNLSKQVCTKGAIHPLILSYRNADKNIALIKSSDLGDSNLAKYLKTTYESHSKIQLSDSKTADSTNSQFLPDDKWKKRFLKFSSQKQKIENPKDYIGTITEAFKELVPSELSTLAQFLNMKEASLDATNLRTTSGSEMETIYGASTQLVQQPNGKFKLEILVSNFESEPIPYLLPLIGHELVHAIGFPNKNKLKPDSEEFWEYLAVEEAVAFDAQMKIFTALARRNPKIFCDWLYVSYSYGDLLVPLSWTMASMEDKLRDGTYIFEYLKLGVFKDKTFLFNPTRTDLSKKIRDKIRSLNLEYVH